MQKEEILLKRVHTPIGLNLGSRQPAEAALDFLVESQMVRHHGKAESKNVSHPEVIR